MAKKNIISIATLTICAFLSNSSSPNIVKAILLEGQNVLRIDLERQYLKQFDNLQLEEQTDIDLVIDAPNIEIDQDLLIENNEMNYSQLREL